MPSDLEIITSIQNKFTERFNFLPQVEKEFYSVGGGIFARLYHDLPVKDVDLFVPGNKYEYFVNHFFVMNNDYSQLDKDGDIIEKPKYASSGSFLSIETLDAILSPKKQAVSAANLISKFVHIPTETKIDIVNIESQSITEYVNKFDFTLVYAYANYSLWSKAFILDFIQEHNPWQDIAEKRLVFTNKLLFGSKKNNTLTRILKFAQLGFKISQEDYFKVAGLIQEYLAEGTRQGVLTGNELGMNDAYSTETASMEVEELEF